MKIIGMGLDHGAWTVLKHIYPKEEFLVFQISSEYKPPEFHYEWAIIEKIKRERRNWRLAAEI